MSGWVAKEEGVTILLVCVVPMSHNIFGTRQCQLNLKADAVTLIHCKLCSFYFSLSKPVGKYSPLQQTIKKPYSLHWPSVAAKV